MARLCPDCGTNLDKFGERHRCRGKVSGQRQQTKLERDRIAKGEMTAADLLTKEKPASSQPAGRLAKLPPINRSAPQPRQSEPSLADVMKELAELKAMIEKLALTLR